MGNLFDACKGNKGGDVEYDNDAPQEPFKSSTPVRPQAAPEQARPLLASTPPPRTPTPDRVGRQERAPSSPERSGSNLLDVPAGEFKIVKAGWLYKRGAVRKNWPVTLLHPLAFLSDACGIHSHMFTHYSMRLAY